MLFSSDKLSCDLNKDKFRQIRKYLESFYIEQGSHPQTNNVIEGGKEGESMHVYEGHQNYPYHPSRLTSDQ